MTTAPVAPGRAARAGRPGWPLGLAARGGQVNGYTVVAWTLDGMAFQAVSDLNTHEFGEFIDLFRATPAVTGATSPEPR